MREHAFDKRLKPKDSEPTPVFRWADLNGPRDLGKLFLDAHPFSFSQSKILLEQAVRSGDVVLAAHLFESLKDKPAVLLPYLPRLAAMEVMDKKTSDEWIEK